MNRYRFILICIIPILLTGCVTEKKFNLLKQQVEENRIEIQKQKEVFYKKLQNLEKRLLSLQQEIKKQTFPLRSNQADLWSEIQKLRDDLAEAQNYQQVMEYKFSQSLNQTRESLSQNIQQTNQNLIQLKEELEKFKREFSQTLIPFNTKKTTSKTVAVKTPKDIYKKAMTLFKEKRYEQAIKIWELLIKKYPKHYLVANAYFWQGESFFKLKKYPQAILKYQTVIENYPKSNKYKAALLKQGISFFKINKKTAGRIVLEKLIRHYPNSLEAKKAKAFLKKYK